MGLKKNLIWTCKKKCIDEHSRDFDTRQYPHIIWENSIDLKDKLKTLGIFFKVVNLNIYKGLNWG